MPSSSSQVDLSVVLPVFNEAESLPKLRSELFSVLDTLPYQWEVIFVDDGSQDRSPEMLRRFVDEEPRVRVIRFARNYGQQMANTAGLRHAQGNKVVIMDADLQTPASEIPSFLAKLEEGYDIVYGVRARVSAPLYRRLGTRFANALICYMTGSRIPDSASGFLALDRQLVRDVNYYNERSRYLSGLFAWLAYGRFAAIPVHRREREFGVSKYRFGQLVRLIINYVTLFSTKPLYVMVAVSSLLTASSALLIAGWAAMLWSATAVSLELTLYAAILLAVGAVQTGALGILGAYVGRVYTDVRESPAYVIRAIYEQDKGNRGERERDGIKP